MSGSKFLQRGVAMIEVLVTLLLVAVGLLGMAGIQYISMKNVSGSYVRYQAALIANDMAERMRANKQYALNGGYAGISTTGTESAVTCSSTCTPAEIKALDVYQWGLQVKALPGGSAAVALASGLYTISINWVEQQTGSRMGDASAGTDSRTFSMIFRP